MAQLAVLTGDIVRSARLPAGGLDRAIKRIEKAAGAAWAWGGLDGAPCFTRFRGDGWQCLAPSETLALRTALLLRAGVRSLGRGCDTRVSVGIGTGDFGDVTLASASGAAFEISGGGLDRIGRAHRLAVAWETPPECADSICAVFALADEIAGRWTPRQADVMVHALQPDTPTQEMVAREIGVTQQMVAKHLSAAGERPLRIALRALEAGEERM